MSREIYEPSDSGHMFRIFVLATVPLGNHMGNDYNYEYWGKTLIGPEQATSHYFGPYLTAAAAKRYLTYLKRHGIAQSYTPNRRVVDGHVEITRIVGWEKL